MQSQKLRRKQAKKQFVPKLGFSPPKPLYPQHYICVYIYKTLARTLMPCIILKLYALTPHCFRFGF